MKRLTALIAIGGLLQWIIIGAIPTPAVAGKAVGTVEIEPDFSKFKEMADQLAILMLAAHTGLSPSELLEMIDAGDPDGGGESNGNNDPPPAKDANVDVD